MNSYLESEGWMRSCLAISSSPRNWWISQGQGPKGSTSARTCNVPGLQPGLASPSSGAACPSQPPWALPETGRPLMANTLSSDTRGWMCFLLRKPNKNSLSILLKTQFWDITSEVRPEDQTLIRYSMLRPSHCSSEQPLWGFTPLFLIKMRTLSHLNMTFQLILN